MPSPLPVEVSAALAHALTAEIAHTTNTRVLFLKGPVSNAHGLRPWRAFQDVDVLADPSGVPALQKGLEDAGWQERPSSLGYSNFVTHSHTYVHPQWGCDIDIHTRYPGMLIDDQDAFEALWENRMQLSVGNRDITTTNFPASAIITALHSLRSMSQARHSTELDHLVTAVTDRMFPDEINSVLVPLVQRLNALEPIRPFLERIGADIPPPSEDSRELQIWRLHSHQHNQAGNWMLVLSETPLRQRPSLLWRALFPTHEDLIIDHPEAADSWHRSAATRITRFGRGVRAFPQAYVRFRDARSTDHDGNDSHTRLSALTDGSPATPDSTVDHAIATPRGTGTEDAPGDWSEAHDSHPSEAAGDLVSPDAIIPLDTCAYEMSWDEATIGLLSIEPPFHNLPLALEGTSAELWKLLAQPLTLEQLIEQVALRYGVETSEVADGVTHFVEEMTTYGIFAPRPAAV